MKRIELFEFTDQSWFPDWIRIALIKILVVMDKAMGVDIAVANLLDEMLKRSGHNTIVDIGSGAGGPMLQVFDRLKLNNDSEDISIILTDLYPNKSAIQQFANHQGIKYLETPFDARNMHEAQNGVKTMINCFHHFSPDLARAVLTSAKEHKQPVMIFEMANNNIPLFVWVLFLPLGLLLVFLMALLFTPFSKPSLKQLFFTYIIPIIPICYAWDGQASMPRIYSGSDIDLLLEGLQDDTYRWTRGPGEGKNRRKIGNYVIGEPIK